MGAGEEIMKNKMPILFFVIILLVSLNLTSCSSTISEDEWEDLMIELGVKTLFCLMDPDFCDLPTLEWVVECTRDEKHRDCCTVTAQTELKVALAEPINNEFERRFRDEMSKRMKKWSTTIFPEDIQWAIRVNQKISLEILDELITPTMEIKIASETRIVSAEDCIEIVRERICGHYNSLFINQYSQDEEVLNRTYSKEVETEGKNIWIPPVQIITDVKLEQVPVYPRNVSIPPNVPDCKDVSP